MSNPRDVTTIQVRKGTKALIKQKMVSYATKHNRGVKISQDDFLRIVMEDLKV
jgi:hypothetical protein